MAEVNQNTDIMVGGNNTAMSQTDQLEQGEQKSSPIGYAGAKRDAGESRR